MEGDLDLVVDAAVGSLAASLLLLVATCAVRVASARRARRDQRLTELWTPVFLGISTERPGPVARRDRRAVLALWNRVRAAVRGPATQPLVLRARQAGLHEVALRLLQSRRPDDRLNAVAAVGALGLPSSLPTLERFARKEASITLRSESARSMLRLDAVRSLRVVLELLRTQSDWHPALIASVVEEADADRASLGVVREAAGAIERGEIAVAARLLRVLPAIDSEACLSEVRMLLADSVDPNIQASALLVIGHFGDRRDRPLVLRHLASDIWFVRVHAVSALGSVGTPDDEPVLTGMLDDAEWWVRQRAAEALMRIAGALGFAADDLTILFEHHPEWARFAGDAYSPLAEVLA